MYLIRYTLSSTKKLGLHVILLAKNETFLQVVVVSFIFLSVCLFFMQ